jgi:hypothetical protein
MPSPNRLQVATIKTWYGFAMFTRKTWYHTLTWLRKGLGVKPVPIPGYHYRMAKAVPLSAIKLWFFSAAKHQRWRQVAELMHFPWLKIREGKDVNCSQHLSSPPEIAAGPPQVRNGYYTRVNLPWHSRRVLYDTPAHEHFLISHFCGDTQISVWTCRIGGRSE